MKLDFSGSPRSIRTAWARLSLIPGGKRLFSMAIGQVAPYSGSIGATIEELDFGHARVTLQDRRKVRNHLNSVHAMALVNLAEVASGVAMMYSIPDNARGILKSFQIDYLKKARGFLTATCDFEPPTTNAKCDYSVDVKIIDTSGAIVAKGTALWRIGPQKETQV